MWQSLGVGEAGEEVGLEVLVWEGGRFQSLHYENLLGTLSRGVMHTIGALERLLGGGWATAGQGGGRAAN